MKALTAIVLSGLLLATTLASADVEIREKKIQFRPEETGATIKGSIKGDETVDSTLRATAGQSMVERNKDGSEQEDQCCESSGSCCL